MTPASVLKDRTDREERSSEARTMTPEEIERALSIVRAALPHVGAYGNLNLIILDAELERIEITSKRLHRKGKKPFDLLTPERRGRTFTLCAGDVRAVPRALLFATVLR